MRAARSRICPGRLRGGGGWRTRAGTPLGQQLFVPDSGLHGEFAAIGKALRFPEWFGHNWDALTDCLLDMGWLPAAGYAESATI